MCEVQPLWQIRKYNQKKKKKKTSPSLLLYPPRASALQALSFLVEWYDPLPQLTKQVRWLGCVVDHHRDPCCRRGGSTPSVVKLATPLTQNATATAVLVQLSYLYAYHIISASLCYLRVARPCTACQGLCPCGAATLVRPRHGCSRRYMLLGLLADRGAKIPCND